MRPKSARLGHDAAMPDSPESEPGSHARHIARLALGLMLGFAGVSHLTFARTDFQAQVPDWVPLGTDFVVLASGVVEIALGAALVFLVRQRHLVGWTVAAFFVAIFPGNISQFMTGTDAFGLDSDLARGIRLLFQPALVAWALWSTGQSWRTAPWRTAPWRSDD